MPGHTRASGLSEGRVTPNTAGAKGRGTRAHPGNRLTGQIQHGKPSLWGDDTAGVGGSQQRSVTWGPHGVPIGQGQGSVTAPHSAGSGPGVLPQLHPGWALAWDGDLPLPTLNPNKMQRKKKPSTKNVPSLPRPQLPVKRVRGQGAGSSETARDRPGREAPSTSTFCLKSSLLARSWLSVFWACSMRLQYSP